MKFSTVKKGLILGLSLINSFNFNSVKNSILSGKSKANIDVVGGISPAFLAYLGHKTLAYLGYNKTLRAKQNAFEELNQRVRELKLEKDAAEQRARAEQEEQQKFEATIAALNKRFEATIAAMLILPDREARARAAQRERLAEQRERFEVVRVAAQRQPDREARAAQKQQERLAEQQRIEAAPDLKTLAIVIKKMMPTSFHGPVIERIVGYLLPNQKTLTGHTGMIKLMVWNHDGSQLISGSSDGTIRLWDIDKGILLKTVNGHTHLASSERWSHDLTKAAFQHWDDTINIYETDTGRLLQTLYGHTKKVNSMAWSPDGNKLASASSDKTIKIWKADEDKGTLLKTLKGHTKRVNSLAWSPDSTKLAFGSRDGTIKIWNIDEKRRIKTIVKELQKELRTNKPNSLLHNTIEPVIEKKNESKVILIGKRYKKK